MTARRHRLAPAAHAAAWAIAGVAACAVVAGTLPLHLGMLARPDVLVLAAVPILASLNHLDIVPARHGRRHEEQHALDEASVVLLLVLLPAGLAWLLSLVGYAIGAVLRRATPVKLAFNIGQWAVSLGVAALLVDRLVPAASATLTPATAVAVVAAVAVHASLNYLAVGAVVCSASAVSWQDRLDATLHVSALSLVGNVLLGLAAAALWLHSPWLAGVAVGLVAVVKDAYRAMVAAGGHVAVVKDAYRAMVAAGGRADAVRIDRDRLDLVISEATSGIVLLDHTGTVTVWNTAMAMLTGVEATEALGRQLDEVFADQTDLVRSLNAGLDGDPSTTIASEAGELPLVHRSGEERVVSVSHRVQHSRLGHVAGDVVQLHDLTAERETARLKDDFLARVTHELRTPLTSIIGYGRTLQQHGDDLPDATREEIRERLVAAGEQMERLVDDLLLVSSGGTSASGRAPSNLEPMPLRPQVDQAVELERADHVGRFIDVRQLQDADAVVESGWLTTVVRHLVCNALTYSDDLSTVVVEIDATDEHALVRVIDEGRGIPPSKLHRVFDRFVRVEDPLRMQTRGAGLGLFIVDRLVARMGGHVEVDSTLGEGSTFVVHLPLTAPVRPPPQAVATHR